MFGTSSWRRGCQAAVSVATRILWRGWYRILLHAVILLHRGLLRRKLLRGVQQAVWGRVTKKRKSCFLKKFYKLLLSIPGVTKLRPAGQIRPAKPFHPARADILPMRKNNITKENLLIWQKHFLKQSHFVRCPAIGLLSNSLCGPRTVE